MLVHHTINYQMTLSWSKLVNSGFENKLFFIKPFEAKLQEEGLWSETWLKILVLLVENFGFVNFLISYFECSFTDSQLIHDSKLARV